MDDDLRAIYDNWIETIPPNSEQFRFLTKYIGKISVADSLGEWIIDNENDGTLDHPVHFPFISYDKLIIDFEKEFYQFSEAHPEYDLTRYDKILEANGIEWSSKGMRSANLQVLDERCILALIMGAIRAERFNDGSLLGFLKDGSLIGWLKRLKDIDSQRQTRIITKIEFIDGDFFGGYTTYHLTFRDNNAELILTNSHGELEPLEKKLYSAQEADIKKEEFNLLHCEYWNADYLNPCVCDGKQWSLTVFYSDGYIISSSGSNAYPENWNSILEFFDINSDDEESYKRRQPGELIYCSVSLEGGCKTYYFTTTDESIQVGDEVIVPVNADNNELLGIVEDIEYFLPENVPFPMDRTKAIIRKIDDCDNDKDDNETGIFLDDPRFLVINERENVDILDENLYCYDNVVFSLPPAIQKKTSEGLFRRIKEFIDSAPAIGKAATAIKDKTEYIPRLDLIPDEIKQALQNGSAELLPCKNASDAFFLQIRTTIKGLVVNGKEYGINKIIKDIPLEAKTIPADITGAMLCLSMQTQLNQIANGLREISEACEFNFGRIIQGQRDDRLAKLFSSRSSFIQAIAMSDVQLQRQLLIQAVRDANTARAELAFQIKSDIALLGGDKPPKAKDMEKIVYDINTAIIAMNNAVQLSLYSYQALGERNSQLAVVKEHETFIKQVLLKEIKFSGKKYTAWILICSSGSSRLAPNDFVILPMKLLDSCSTFIEGNKAKYYLEEKLNG